MVCCGVVWCVVLWCGVLCCVVLWCGVVWCVVLCCVGCGVVWYGDFVVWYGDFVVWYGDFVVVMYIKVEDVEASISQGKEGCVCRECVCGVILQCMP